ncbi:MAG: alpha/beta hydrolase [Kiritimatiellae bacterium]|nr:alpha/beta hydrolase [Kiritimatiellia bacterium]
MTVELPGGLTKVPIVGSGNSYEDGLSSEKKNEIVEYGKLADAAYGKEAPPPGCEALSKKDVESLLSGSSNKYEVKPDGTITLKGLKGGSGFNAMLFWDSSNPKKLVVAYRGTEGFTAPGDLWTDAVQVVGTSEKPTTQYQAAADVLNSVLANHPGEVVVTGHSLGGGLANYAMAANDLDGRVKGYTYNAAGLSEETWKHLQTNNRDGLQKASDATVNVRNEGDPVSYVGAHVGAMYEVANPDGVLAAHGIECLVGNLEKTKDVDGTKQGDPSMDYKDPFEQAAEALANGLSAVLPADQAQFAAALLSEYARIAVLAGAQKLDEKIAAELDRLEKRLQKIMPGDMSSQALSETIAALKRGDIQAAASGLENLAMGAAEDVVRDGLAKAGITGQEADAIVQGAKDAIKTAIDGGDVGASIVGSVENYVYDKIKGRYGEETAAAWMNAWEDVKNGNDPWVNLKDAALKTATVEFEKFADRVGNIIDKRLSEMLKDHPFVSEMFAALGISGQSFANGLKWVWGVLTGPGSLAGKLKAIGNAVVQGLKDMVSKLAKFALDKAKQFLNALLNKVAKKVIDAVNKVIAEVNKIIDKANAIIRKINGYIRKIKDFAKMVRKISARVGKVLVDIGAAANSAGVQLMQDIESAARKIDAFVDELPTINNVPSIPQPAGP